MSFGVSNLHINSIDFSKPSIRWGLILAIAGLILAASLFKPFSFSSATSRKLLPSDVVALGTSQLNAFGVESEDQLVTTLPVQDNSLILFVRDHLKPTQGNQQLKDVIPGAFWEVAFRSLNDHTTAFESNTASAGYLSGWREMHHALVRIDENGRWFQFYHSPDSGDQVERLSQANALNLARDWALFHPLVVPGVTESFDPSIYGEPQVRSDRDTYRFQWAVPTNIEGLNRVVAIEVIGSSVAYYGLEFEIAEGYREVHRSLWRLSLGLQMVLFGIAIPLILYLLIKQLRRDAIDFHFSFTYSALLTSPLIAINIANLPGLMNERFMTVVKESFYLLSSATLFWLVMLFVATPIVALTDSLVRQVWPEKLSTFDALIRGRIQLPTIGRACFIGLSFGIATLGLLSLGHTLFTPLGGYAHSTILVTSLAGPLAAFWALVGSLGLALLFGYLLLLLTTLISYRIENTYIIAAIVGVIWVILISANGGRYSSIINFGFFALTTTGVSIFLILRFDLLTLIAAYFGGFVTLTGLQLLAWDNLIYRVNGAVVLVALATIYYASRRLASDVEHPPEPEFVPEYITRLQSRERIERDIEIARQLQFQFLPQEIPEIDKLEIATLCRPAYEVGGDYYDFIELGKDRLGLVIADVAGKGIPAAFYMTMIKGIIQSTAVDEAAPNEILKQINWVIYKNTGSHTFVTLFYAIIDAKQGTLVYSNAGHNPPLIVSRDGQIQELSCGGVVLGVLPDPDYAEETVKLTNGDLIILYTDGVIERTDVLGQEFGSQRLAATLKNREGYAASHLIDTICEALDTFAAGAPQADDVTMILVSFNQDEKTNNRN